MLTIHPKLGLTDQIILKVITTLFGRFKRALKQGKYVFFPPAQIIVYGKGEKTKVKAVAMSVSEVKPNIKECEKEREAFRLLGVSLYHLITGESELNYPSYLLDGYGKTLQSVWWPCLNLLLSEQECTLSKVQKLFREIGKQIKLPKPKKKNKKTSVKVFGESGTGGQETTIASQSIGGQTEASAATDQASPVSQQRGDTIITRTVTVNYDRTPQQALLDAARLARYTNRFVISAMPKNGIGQQEVTVEFFKLGRCVSDAGLAREYEKRSLAPADPFVLSKVNEDEQSFADEYTNGTHWQDEQGRWCFAAFYRGGGGRCVDVGRNVHDWNDYCWFAGVRK